MNGRPRKLCSTGTIVDKLYQLDCDMVLSEKAAIVSTQPQANMIDTWHLRLRDTLASSASRIWHRRIWLQEFDYPRELHFHFVKNA